MDEHALYQGDGSEFVNGVPARNMTEAEWHALPPEKQLQAVSVRLRNGQPMYSVAGVPDQLPPAEEGHPAPAPHPAPAVAPPPHLAAPAPHPAPPPPSAG